MLNLKIESVAVYLTAGADKIVVKTNLPCPYGKKYDQAQNALELDFQASYNTGYEYCKRVFGVTPRLFNIR